MRSRIYLWRVGGLVLALALVSHFAVAEAGVVGAPSMEPASTYYFAEGSTQPPFDTWFLVQNPTGNATTATFTFQLEGGAIQTHTVNVGANTRVSIFANQILPNAAFSTRVDSPGDIFVERSMFVGFDGSDITGIPAPSKQWLFAEGATVSPFHTWVLIQNPNPVPANTTITYMLPNEPPVVQALGALAPTSRTSIFMNQLLPDKEFSIKVDSDQPVVAERSMFRFPGNAATTAAGVTAPDNRWLFAEGSSLQSPMPFDTFLLLQNPNPIDSPVTISLYDQTGKQTTLQQTLPSNSRQTIFLNSVLPNSSFDIVVDSQQPIVAERSMYFGLEPRGATASPGSTALAKEWNLPEGSTQPPFTEVIAIFSFNPEPDTARIDFQLESGQVITHNFQTCPLCKLSVNVNDLIPGNALSAKVTTKLPTVVERTMYFQKLDSTGGTNAAGILNPATIPPAAAPLPK